MANVTWTVPNKNGSYDGDMVVKHFTSFTINAGDTVTVDQPCRGLLIFVEGDVNINGTLSMKGKGAAANPASVGGSDSSATNSSGLMFPYIKSGGQSYTSVTGAFSGCGNDAVNVVSKLPAQGTGYVLRIPRSTGSGAARRAQNGSLSFGQSGDNGGNGDSGTLVDTFYKLVGTAGGGSGGMYSDENSCSGDGNGNSGAGGNGTCWSGGSGGGGQMSGSQGGGSTPVATDADDYGGVGGNAGNSHCGGPHTCTGGIGNNNGLDVFNCPNNPAHQNSTSPYQTATWTGDNGNGGSIIIVCGGNFTIGSTGVITVRGTNNPYSGSNGTFTRNTGGLFGGGGASGAGSLTILHRGTYTLTSGGEIQREGGATGTNAGGVNANRNGGPGGTGGLLVEQIS